MQKVQCDNCGKRRPLQWALMFWTCPLGGRAGYYDFCSYKCEKEMVDKD